MKQRLRCWPRRLRNQLILLTGLLLSATIIFFAWDASRRESDFTAANIRAQAVVLARNIASTGGGYLFSTYYSALEELLTQSAEFPGVEAIFVTDADGRLIREVRRNNDLIVIREPRQLTPPLGLRERVEQNDTRITVWYPIISGFLQGWVRIDYSLAVLHRQQREIFSTILRDGAVALLLSLALLFLYLRRPMRSLESATHFAAGLNDHRGNTVNLDSRAVELEILERALNRASLDLRAQDEKIISTLTDLETQKFALDQHAIVSMTDINGIITYANDRFCQISRYEKEELIGHKHNIVNSGVHSQAFFRNMWETIRAGKVWQGEVCNRAKNGDHYWVNTTIVPFLNDEGEPFQFVAIRNDISALKATAAALSESRERLHQSQVFARIGNWDWDIRNGSVFWSETVSALLGQDEHARQVSYDTFLNMVHPDDRENVEKAIRACLEDGDDFDIEHRVVLSDGEVRWIHEAGNVLRDTDGRPRRMLGIAQDITQRIETEIALRESEEMIRHSQKMQAIGTLAGGIAHDFNNILFAIAGYAELIEMDAEPDSEALDNATQILQASERARSLINQILAFSRKSSMESQSIQPYLVAREVMKLMRATVPTTIRIDHELESRDYIAMDPTQLHQIIMNLCVNANHAIGDNSGVIKISLHKQELLSPLHTYQGELEPGDYVCLAVSDTGQGIPPEVLPRIFDPFFTTKDVGKGTGMGLASIHGLISAAGGGITVATTVNKGSTFSIYIPITSEPDEEQPLSAVM